MGKDAPRIVNARFLPKGWQKDPRYAYCGRGAGGRIPDDPRVWGGLGNPFKLGDHEPRGATLDRHEYWMHRRLRNELDDRRDGWLFRECLEALLAEPVEFAVCWCAPKDGLAYDDEPCLCHAQTLVRCAVAMRREENR